jgi:hypothetical protein
MNLPPSSQCLGSNAHLWPTDVDVEVDIHGEECKTMVGSKDSATVLLVLLLPKLVVIPMERLPIPMVVVMMIRRMMKMVMKSLEMVMEMVIKSLKMVMVMVMAMEMEMVRKKRKKRKNTKNQMKFTYMFITSISKGLLEKAMVVQSQSEAAIVDAVVVAEEPFVVKVMVPTVINNQENAAPLDANAALLDANAAIEALAVLAMVSETVTGVTAITSDSTTVATESMLRATSRLVHYSLMTGTE